jgi:hypothetical protein
MTPFSAILLPTARYSSPKKISLGSKTFMVFFVKLDMLVSKNKKPLNFLSGKIFCYLKK